MQFVFHERAGESQVLLQGETHQHLFKARRSTQKIFHLRNLKDDVLYTYECVNLNRRDASLRLQDSLLKPIKPLYPLHLILAMIDMKHFEKALPTLNELGVGKITLFKSAYTQHHFKVDMDRLYRILISSCCQCGRSDLVCIEEMADLQTVLTRYPQALRFDFGGKPLGEHAKNPCVIIGPEGGFSDQEREEMKELECIATTESLILRSESAAIYLQANAMRFY